MSVLDWRQLQQLDIDTLQADASVYVRALFLKKDWSRLLQLTFDPFYADEVLRGLKVPFVRKQLFGESAADELIGFLDQVNDVFRKQILTMLIENFEKVPLAQTIGETLLQSPSSHPWAVALSKYVLSLQSEAFLDAFLKGKAPGVDGFLQLPLLVPLRVLGKRKKIGGLIVDHYIESLKEKSTEFQFAAQTLVQSQELWGSQPDVVARLKEAVRSHPHRLSSWYPTNLGSPQIASSTTFPVDLFYKLKFVNEEFILTEYVLKTFDEEKDLPIEKQERTLELALQPVTLGGTAGNLLITLASLSVDEPENPFGQVLKRAATLRGFAYARHFSTTFDGSLITSLLTSFLQGIHLKTLSFEGFTTLLSDVVRRVLDYKKVIARDDPNRYTLIVTRLLQTIIAPQLGALGPQYWSQYYQAESILPANNLSLLPEELSDELVVEAITEPSGLKPLNPVLAQQPIDVALMLSLLVRNLKTQANLIDHGKKKSKSDNFGFLPEFSLNFPPLASEASQTAEPWKGSIHVFERALIKKRLLQHLDINISSKAILIYKLFVVKVLTAANDIGDADLLKQAVGVHYRFCRFLLGKTRDELRSSYWQTLVSMVAHPLILSVGQKTSESFATELFESLISRIPVGQAPHLLYSLLLYLIQYGRSPLLPESESVAATLVTLVLDRLFRKLPPTWSNPSFVFDASLISLPIPSLTLLVEASKQRQNAQNSHVVPPKFRNLVLRHLFSTKATADYRYPLLEKDVFEADPNVVARQANFVPSVKVISAVLAFVGSRLETYTDAQFALSSTAVLTQLIAVLKQHIPAAVELILKSPIPANIDRYVEKHTVADYRRALANFTFVVNLSPAVIPLLRTYAELSGSATFAELLSELGSDERYALFQKVMNFTPIDPAVVERQRLPPYGERKTTAYTPAFTIKFAPSAYVEYRFANVKPEALAKKPQKPDARKTDKFFGVLADVVLRPIFALDGPKFASAVPDAISFVRLASSSGKFTRELRSAPPDVSIFGYFLKVIIADLCVTDPEPTEADPSPRPIPTYFAGTDAVVPAPKVKPPKGQVRAPPRRRRAVAVAAAVPKASLKQPGAPHFRANKYLLALLSSSLRKSGLLDRLDFDVFADPLLELLDQPTDKVCAKLGEDNLYFFSNEVALLVLSKIRFGTDLHALDSSASADKLTQVYFRLLSSPVFHHGAADVLLQHVQSLSSIALRRSIITRFLSGCFSSAFSFTMHTRTRLTMWSLSPAIVGFPLPDFSLAFAAKLGDDEKLHVDVRRSILASAVAYFKYQEVAKIATPVHAQELFDVLDKTVTSARDSLTPTCIWVVRESLAAELSARSPASRDLLPPAQKPSAFSAIPGVVPEFPKTGEWKPLYEKFVSSFIGPGLLTGHPQLLLLVIAALTQLCAETTEVSSKIEPFIVRGLNQIDAGRPSAVLVNFAYHFCFLSTNSVYTGLIDKLVDVFARVRKYVEEFAKEHQRELWGPASTQVSMNGLNEYVSGLTGPFNAVFVRSVGLWRDVKEAEWLHVLAGRILAALRPSERLAVRIVAFDNLVDWVQLLAADELAEALPNWGNADSWGPMLRLAGRARSLAHAVFQSFFGRGQVLPPKHLEDIAAWPEREFAAGEAYALTVLVRGAVAEWMKEDVAEDVRARVLTGLWRFAVY